MTCILLAGVALFVLQPPDICDTNRHNSQAWPPLFPPPGRMHSKQTNCTVGHPNDADPGKTVQTRESSGFVGAHRLCTWAVTQTCLIAAIGWSCYRLLLFVPVLPQHWNALRCACGCWEFELELFWKVSFYVKEVKYTLNLLCYLRAAFLKKYELKGASIFFLSKI